MNKMINELEAHGFTYPCGVPGAPHLHKVYDEVMVDMQGFDGGSGEWDCHIDDDHAMTLGNLFVTTYAEAEEFINFVRNMIKQRRAKKSNLTTKEMNKITIYQFTTTWDSCDHITYMAVRGAESVGTCMVDYCGEDKTDTLLWNLQVANDCRKGGIAKMLVAKACKDAAARGCEEITLEWGAMDSDGWIFDWYKRIGFNYDCHTHRSVRMKKTLK